MLTKPKDTRKDRTYVYYLYNNRIITMLTKMRDILLFSFL